MNKIHWSNTVWQLGKLKPYHKNPRTITKKAFTELKDKIARLGYHAPILCNRDGAVLSGNQKLQALAELDYKTVDVRIPDRELTDIECEEIVIECNLHAGTWDFDILANEFDAPSLIEWGMDPELIVGNTEDHAVDASDMVSEPKLCKRCPHKDID